MESVLEQYTINLNEKAKNDTLDPVFGRKKEITKITSVLLRRTKNNPLLLGLPGVGKTAIAEELARSIVNETCHNDLLDKQILLLDTVGLIAGTSERGKMEERVTSLMADLQDRDDIILMIDEIHMLVSDTSGNSKNSKSSLNIANMFKPGLARGLFHCIGATTFTEYAKYLCNDKAFERRFQPITIVEPTVTDTIEILYLLKHKYEEYHGCVISDDAIVGCVNLANRFLPYRNFPDKAIDLLDESCSKMKIDLKNNKRNNNIITLYDVEEVMKQIIDVPLRLENEDNRIMMLEMKMRKNIVGQDTAIDTIVKTIKRHVCGFYNKNRPIASMMFLGPTGTGKTETVNLLADYYFGSREKNIIRFDMSEYMEAHTVSSLIGPPPGYVGYEEGGRLTNAIKYNPYSIVLFDEIEKANYKIYDTLLQILEDGIVTDGMNNTYSFKNTIVIFTSNIGFTHRKSQSLGFSTNEPIECTYNIKNIFEEMKYTFKPEFLNRLDTILPFDYLSEDSIKTISSRMIEEFINDIYKRKQIHVLVTDETRAKIYQCGTHLNYGARPLRNSITKLIIDPVCERILEDEDNLTNKWIVV
jgi:ATP-dependent Clp protease ATP-binding subunit ClpC